MNSIKPSKKCRVTAAERKEKNKQNRKKKERKKKRNLKESNQ